MGKRHRERDPVPMDYKVYRMMDPEQGFTRFIHVIRARDAVRMRDAVREMHSEAEALRIEVEQLGRTLQEQIGFCKKLRAAGLERERALRSATRRADRYRDIMPCSHERRFQVNGNCLVCDNSEKKQVALEALSHAAELRQKLNDTIRSKRLERL